MTEAAIVCSGLTRCFGQHIAVDRINLTVPSGTILGLLGRNGAGKTTLLRMILGLLRPTNGSIQVLGQPAESTDQAHRSRIGFLAEDHPVHAWMTVRGLARFHAAVFPRFDHAVFASLIQRAGLPLRDRLGSLSRGQRASACLAATIAADPDLLILDDPGLGLDTAARRDLLDAILETVRRPGRTVILSSHHMADIDRVSDRVAVLDGGVLRADCTLDRFRASIRRFVFHLSTPLQPQRLPGLLTWSVEGDAVDAIVVAHDATPDALAQAIGASAVREVPVTLDEICTAYTGPRRPQATLASTLSTIRSTADRVS
jgi:ABC-2 type transport system ATP-binding protein